MVTILQEMEVEDDAMEPRPDVNADSEDDMEGFDAVKLLAAESKKKVGGFQALGLGHNLLKGVQKKGYKQPTPIQRKVRLTRLTERIRTEKLTIIGRLTVFITG